MREWLVAGGLVERDDGRLLLVQNRRRDGSLDWTPPGGVIDHGETIHEGLAREVREETGLDVRVDGLAILDGYRPDAIALIFRCSVIGGELRAQPGEIGAVHWMTDAELDRMEPWRRRLIRLARGAKDGGRYIA